MSIDIDNMVRQAAVESTAKQSNEATRMLWTTFRRAGVHSHPDALVKENLADVSYLGHPHRHLFHFRVEIQSRRSNTDINPTQFKLWLESIYAAEILTCDNRSLEELSDELYAQIALQCPMRCVTINVSEDGETGMSIYYGVIQK